RCPRAAVLAEVQKRSDVTVRETSARLPRHGVVDEGVEVPLLGRGGLIDVIKNIPDDRDFGSLSAVVTAAHTAGGIGRSITVRMHEDVSFDPRVRAVEIQQVVVAAHENVIQEMHNRATPIAAREINRVVVTADPAEEVARED